MGHIDTYQSPTSWTDFGMDWENPDAQDAHYIDALWQAILERYIARDPFNAPYMNYFANKAISSDRKFMYRKEYDGGLFYLDRLIKGFINGSPLSYLNPSQLLNLGLISAGDTYVNANNSSGTDYGFIFNILTLESVCDILGIDYLLSPQQYFMDNSQWLRQCYNILNLCKYTYTGDYAGLGPSLSKLATTTSKVRYVVDTNDPYYAGDPSWHKDETITSIYPLAFNGNSSTASKSIYGSYYYVNNAELQSTSIYYFYDLSKYKPIAYIKKYDNLPPEADYSYFKTKDGTNYPGWYYAEINDSEFKSGINSVEIPYLNDVSDLLPYPVALEDSIQYTNHHFISIPYFIHEFDFNFKA